MRLKLASHGPHARNQYTVHYCEERGYNMALDVAAVADKEIKNVVTGDTIPFKNLWQDQTTLIIFFRRWGCLFCRLWARELADLAPVLKENNIRLVGIGVDEIGLDDFVKGKYFAGDLYIDSNKTIYSGLNLKRFNWLSILTGIVTSESRAAIRKGRAEHLGGDLKGDGLQNGGALIVKKGGDVLFSFRQDRPAEHIPNEKFAEILKVKYTPMTDLKTNVDESACDRDQCSR